MNPNEEKQMLNGKVLLKINSKFPAGQGYSPRIIKETHYNVSLNGHVLNLPEGALNFLVNLLEGLEQPQTPDKTIAEKDCNCDLVDQTELSSLQNDYELKFGKPAPFRYKNDKLWLEKKINE